MSIGSVVAAVLAMGVVGCGSGETANYSNCGAVSQFGACAAPAVCEQLCDCLTEGAPAETSECLSACSGNILNRSEACIACIGESTCEELIDDAGPCATLCEPLDMAGDQPL